MNVNTAQFCESYGYVVEMRKGKRKSKEIKTLYVAVTNDKYELPCAVGDTMRELADMMGKDVPYLSRFMNKIRPRAEHLYRKIELDEYITLD